MTAGVPRVRRYMFAEARDFDAVNRIPFAHPEALTDPEKLLAAYFSSTTVGLAIFDTGLRYLAINKALAEMHGVPTADHLGKTVREVLGNFADRIEPEFQRVLATGEGVNFEVSAQLLQQPEAGHWIAHYLPIKDNSGTVTRIGAVVVDLTAQKRLEESLKDTGERLRKEMERLRMVLDVSGVWPRTGIYNWCFRGFQRESGECSGRNMPVLLCTMRAQDCSFDKLWIFL